MYILQRLNKDHENITKLVSQIQYRTKKNNDGQHKFNTCTVAVSRVMFFLLDICLPMFCFTPFSSIITVGRIAWKKPSTNPSLLWNGKRECTFTSHEEQKNLFGQSWHLISVFSSEHIWQWSGEGRLSRLRRASSSFLLLSQLDDKFTFLVFQFLDGLFVEPRNSLILAKAASRLSVEQYSYLC